MWRENREYMLSVVRKAHQKNGRKPGVPDGYTAQEMEAVRAQAAKDAERIIQIMEDQGLIDPVPPVTDEEVKDDAQLAREALKAAVQIMREPGGNRDKLAAARTVLEWTKAKPASKIDATVQTAEDFLGALLAKDQQGK